MFAPGSQKIMTVLGSLQADWEGVVDAHNHVWITALQGVNPANPILDDPQRISKELIAYRQAGGAAIVDCQPGGCGRDGVQLQWLARQSGVHLIGCTGFHRPHYYPSNSNVWTMNSDLLARRFVSELRFGMEETLYTEKPALAGFIKVAVETRLKDTRQAALEAAAIAAVETDAAIQAHTEKGSEAEHVLAYFTARGIHPQKLILCHIDKRPDHGLHHELAQAGALLEYDTFYRPKYNPEKNLWPLIYKMANAGLERSVALATDMAETNLWKQYGGSPGLVGLLEIICPRLLAMGLDREAIAHMLGKNILARLTI